MRHVLGRLLCLSLLLIPFRPHAEEPPAVASKEVSFESEGVTLIGTLFQPAHPRAAVVIVHGSGQEKRMTDFATRLARDGIAVLTYDKRGVGASGGVYAGPEVGTNNVDAANLELLAADAGASVDALVARLPSRDVPVGLVGFSQAAWIIPLAAKKHPGVHFMVIFSGPVVTAREQLRFQFYTQGAPDFWKTHTEADARDHIRNDPDRYQFADTDPRDALAALSIPGLWLYGAVDVQAPVQLSVERLDALKAQGKAYESRVFPGLGHNVAFADSSEPVDAAVKWITARSHIPPDNRQARAVSLRTSR